MARSLLFRISLSLNVLLVGSFDVMSHYYHIYPGNEGLGRGTPYRWVKEAIPPGGHGLPPRSSTPSRSGSTPPPPGVSPVRARTPPGVFTQVQTNNGNKDDDDLSEDLFNDSFDVNDIPEEMLDSRSNLTQIFPHCTMEDAVEPEKCKPSLGDQPAPNKEPDLLSKVLAHATSLEEDEKISQLDLGGNPSDHPNDARPKQQNREQQQQQQQPSGPEFQPRRHSSVFTTAEGENMEHSTGVQDGSSDWGSFGTENSSRLSPQQIQALIRGLTPDPIVRSMSEGCQGLPPPTPPLSRAPSERSQVSLDDEWGAVRKIVPTATSSRPRTSSSSSYQISDNAREIATAVRHARHAVVDIVDGVVVETGLERHDFPPVGRDMVTPNRIQDQSATGLEEEIEITIPEIIDNIKDQVNVTFTTGPVAKFILVARDSLTSRWSVPSRLRFHDVVNQAESRIRRNNLSCGSVLDWCSEWGGGGGVGLLGLRVIHPRELNTFRTVITEIRIGGLWYNTYPKDFLAHNTEVSVLLKQELRCLDLQFLPHSLFEKNSLLSGNIRVRYSRHRDERNDDPTVAPLLQDGGKVVILEADEEFALSLQSYPNNYSFRLGSYTAKLRCESDIIDYNDMATEMESLIINTSAASSSSSTVRGGSASSEARGTGQRARRTRMALNSESFQLPYPVPSAYREKSRHHGSKVGSRGKGKFRGKHGSGMVIKKSWNKF